MRVCILLVLFVIFKVVLLDSCFTVRAVSRYQSFFFRKWYSSPCWRFGSSWVWSCSSWISCWLHPSRCWS